MRVCRVCPKSWHFEEVAPGPCPSNGFHGWRQRWKRPIAIWLYVPWLPWLRGRCGRWISGWDHLAAKGLFWRLLSGLFRNAPWPLPRVRGWFPSTWVLKSTAPLWPFLGMASWACRSGRECVTMGQVLTCALLGSPTKTTEEKHY